MAVGIIGFGILTSFAAGALAMFAGYSILMVLWFYTLFGTLAALFGILLTYTIVNLVQRWQRQHALPG